MINPGVIYQAYCKSRFNHSDAELNVFAETHIGKSVGFIEYVAGNAHVKTTWMEGAPNAQGATADASGSQKRRHTVADGLLHRGEGIVLSVGSAKGVEIQLCYRIVYRLHVCGRYRAIGI